MPYSKNNTLGSSGKKRDSESSNDTTIIPMKFDVPSDSISPDPSLFDPRLREMGEIQAFSNSELDEKKLIFPEMKQSRIINRFRELRTRLLHLSDNKNFTVVVTSTILGGGATHVASNLAAAFSIDSSKTSLLVDAHLSKPGLENLFGIKVKKGLTEFLEDPSVQIEDIIYSSGLNRLRVVPAGRRTEYTSEYFNSGRMKNFLESTRARYPDRFIVLDAPPLTESADVRQLLQLADLAIVVVPYGKMTGTQISENLGVIPKEKLAGIVVNNEITLRYK